MKMIILGLLMAALMVLLSGCGLTKAFDVTYVERQVCAGYSTDWVNDTKVTTEAVYSYINRTGWQAVAYDRGYSCKKETIGTKT